MARTIASLTETLGLCAPGSPQYADRLGTARPGQALCRLAPHTGVPAVEQLVAQSLNLAVLPERRNSAKE